jgi:UDP-glucose 4-epimerase
MKIIVTGAVGHIGSCLIRDLAIQFPGANIVMIDNMLTQRFPSLFNLSSLAKYEFIEADITSIDLRLILKDAYVLIHLAAITDAAGSVGKAELLEANNYQATLKVAEACALSGTRLIALSSTSVYGTQNKIVSEDCNLDELKPQSPYAVTKLKEEELVTSLCKFKGLRAISCRFGTIYGASLGMRFHTAVNKFCWQAVMGQSLTVWSTAYEQKRPYLDLFDAVRAITFIIRNDIFDGRIYNVLTHNSTVHQIVDTIRYFVPDLQLSFVDSKIMNQLSYEVSCERFTRKGFIFSGNLRRGVGETIELLRRANYVN